MNAIPEIRQKSVHIVRTLSASENLWIDVHWSRTWHVWLFTTTTALKYVRWTLQLTSGFRVWNIRWIILEIFLVASSPRRRKIFLLGTTKNIQKQNLPWFTYFYAQLSYCLIRIRTAVCCYSAYLSKQVSGSWANMALCFYWTYQETQIVSSNEYFTRNWNDVIGKIF